MFLNDPDFIELTRNRTPEETEKEFSDFYLEKVKEENIVFTEIDRYDFNFYLSAPIYKKIFIKKDETHSFDPFINDFYLKPVKDSEGNIQDIEAPSDMWQAELFEGLAAFTNEGSYILFVDDTGKFWKVEFDNKKVRYFIQNR